MSNTKVIVLSGSSSKSWEDAVQQSVAKASETVSNISRVDVVHQSACVRDGRVSEFRATVHISFEIEAENSPDVETVAARESAVAS